MIEEYEQFVAKFGLKKTTDDCYTPDNIYEAVLSWCNKHIKMKGLKVLRPFCPGGDYEHVNYPNNCIVIDNPPFSILSKIRRFYIERNIPYFLFSPHLTLFSANVEDTKIVTNSDITYDNGACVRTSFVSNCFGDVEIMTAPELAKAVYEANKENFSKIKKTFPKYEYPKEVLTVSSIATIADYADIRIARKDVRHISKLDCQKEHKKRIFGDGYLISDKVKEVIEKAKIDKVTTLVKEGDIKPFVWSLSDREKAIIEELSQSNS